MSTTSARNGTRPGLRGWWATLSESLQARLWPVPVATVIVAVGLGIVLTRLDVRVDSHLPGAVDSAVFNGGADTARSVLSAIAGSLITATSLTFSLTVIALQLASSQASPRVLRLFARDRQVHWTLAAFLGTFAYSITVLRSVRSGTENIAEFVPRISVTVGFVLTLASVLMLVFFLAHLAAQLRVETMLKDIHAETDRTIDLVGDRNAAAAAYPHVVDVPSDSHAVVAQGSGFITRHGHDRLMRVAGQHEIVVQESVRVGASIIAGMPLASWWPVDGVARRSEDRDAIEDGVRGAFTIGYERTAAQDIDYGIQQITDIAVRALSPGINDPTTAVNALGHLSALLARVLSMTRLPAALCDGDGHLRVVPVAREARDDVDAALTPIRHHGAGEPSVVARFVQAVAEVSTLCPDSAVQRALCEQLDALARQLRSREGDPAAATAALALVERARADIESRVPRIDAPPRE